MFQPIVDTLANRWTHYGLARWCMYVAAGCMAVAACLFLTTTLWWSALAYLVATYTWAKNAKAYELMEELEAKGLVLPPILWMAYLRVLHLMTFAIILLLVGFFIVLPASETEVMWSSCTALGWASASCAHYFAGCHPGTPRRRYVFRWQPVG